MWVVWSVLFIPNQTLILRIPHVSHRQWFWKLILHNCDVSNLCELFVWMPHLVNKKLVRAGWHKECESPFIPRMCGDEALESGRVNMYKTVLRNQSSKLNKRKKFFCTGWPRWGQYKYWPWHCQGHVLHDDNLIKMCWWQKAYQTKNVLVHR